MMYPIALAILAAYFGVIGAFALREKHSPEPPPRGGVRPESEPRVSFKEFHRERAAERQHDAILAQKRSA